MERPAGHTGLASLGWCEWFERAFKPCRDRGWIPGRVALEDRQTYSLLTDGDSLTAAVAGRLMHRTTCRGDLPKVGDWVAVQPLAEPGKGTICQVLPRRTQLARKVKGRRLEVQVLAANVDVVFLVLALDQSFNRRRLERGLLMVHDSGAQPAVILNKLDLCHQPEDYLRETRLGAGEVPVLVTSASRGTGLDQLWPLLKPGRTVAFLGASGVGKSSLINRLYGEDIQATLEVREQDAKGRHATTWRELIVLPGGALVIDTPGTRELQIWEGDEGLQGAFEDISVLGDGCRFTNCSHISEPDCAVRAALASGVLSEDRYGSYLKLRREVEFLARERRHHTYAIHRRSGNTVAPRSRGARDSREAEPSGSND
jgi:ribosome biogenesis GTPase